MNKVNYAWERFNNSQLAKIKKRFALEEIVTKGKDEFEKQLFLKEWVYESIGRGIPAKDYSYKSATEILVETRNGKNFYCTQFAFVFLQCSLSLGWHSRKLSIDIDHALGEESLHHGVADIWSNQFKKWYVVGPMNNLHYEKNGIPLNALEIRSEYLKDINKRGDVKSVIGNKKECLSSDWSLKKPYNPSNYFWIAVSLRNNFMERPGIFETKMLLWVDRYNKNKIWYKGGNAEEESHKHPMYKGQFIKTNDQKLFFPEM